MKINEIIERIEREPKSLISLKEENALVEKLVRAMILGRDAHSLSLEIVEENNNVLDGNLGKLMSSISEAIKSNSKESFSNDDWMHIEKIIINQLNKNPETNNHELIKDLKIALAVNSHEEEFLEKINEIKIRYLISFESLGIDPRFKPSRKDFYIEEERKGEFIAIAPNNSRPEGYVLGFSKNKILFLGYKDGILKEEYTRSRYKIKLLYGLLPGGKKITKLNGKGLICKGVPLEEISDSLAEKIKRLFLSEKSEISIGISLSSGGIRRTNGKIELESLPYSELLDDLQSRIAVVGGPGTGKTLFTNIIQKQVMNNNKYLQGGVVTISKDVPHLANVGNRFLSFGEELVDWDMEGSSKEFLDKTPLRENSDHRRIVISPENQIPNINLLSKETIIAMVDNADCSPQVKTALKKCLEESKDVVNTLKNASEGKLLGEEYLSSQDSALRRLINSIIPANYEKIEKINLKQELSLNKNLSFFIKGTSGDSYATMIMWELYSLQKDKEITNPSIQGRLLVIDECQKFNRDAAFRDIFQRTVLDGRNFGICMLTIFQNQKDAEKNIGYPDFVCYSTSLDDGKRIVNVREKTALIPTIAPEVKHE